MSDARLDAARSCPADVAETVRHDVVADQVVVVTAESCQRERRASREVIETDFDVARMFGIESGISEERRVEFSDRGRTKTGTVRRADLRASGNPRRGNSRGDLAAERVVAVVPRAEGELKRRVRKRSRVTVFREKRAASARAMTHVETE